MRDVPISLVNSMSLEYDVVKRYVIPGIYEWRRANGYPDIREWIQTPEGQEIAEWVRDNLSQFADLVPLFEREWVITTSNKDDQVLLALKFGIQ